MSICMATIRMAIGHEADRLIIANNSIRARAGGTRRSGGAARIESRGKALSI